MSESLRAHRKLKLVTRRWRVALAALLPVSALLAGVFTSTPASALVFPGQPGGLFPAQVVSDMGDFCLDNWMDELNLYNPVVAYPCNPSDMAQGWFFSGGQIEALTSDDQVWCLDVYAGGGIGSNVDLYPCNGTGAQQWVLNSNGQLKNPQSGGCLDIPDWGRGLTPSGGPPTQLHISACGGPNINPNNLYGPWQTWSVSE